MGTGSKVGLVLFRVWQIICAAIVLGILSRFLLLVNQAGAWRDGRIIYGIITGSISLVFSIVFIVPFLYAFMGFLMDFILWIMWLVLFSLLASRTTGGRCSSHWYYDYWGYYWGRWWLTPVRITGPWDIAWAGCSSWRAALAFSFLAMIGYLVTAILGAAVVSKWRNKDKNERRTGTPAVNSTTQISGPTNVTGGPTHTGAVGGTTTAPSQPANVV
ncbi:hypothetical protein VTJ49DRAFT_2711 [Mycothermus thermophilus]|uniref:MARVEL domain-containing protein n=1 Tax=Humicola insolens TaxID=85995 RepID=A0ABR3V9C9_HUMIN